MKKHERIAFLKRERKRDKKFSPNNTLNYRIHQMSNRVRKGDKGHGCAKESMRVMRAKYPMLLTRQSGGTAQKHVRGRKK